jgi:putative hydrolase of the HAD superfamily
MIRVLVVDLDGVLRLLDKRAAQEACKKLGFELDELNDVLWHDEFGRALLRGKTTRHEWWKKVQAKDHRLKRVSHRRVMQSVYDNTSSIDSGLLAYLKTVSKTIAVSIFSNSDTESKKVILRSFGKGSPFTHVVASSDVGYTKPDAQSFLEMLRVVGVRPQECLFFDDKESNVAAAASLGIDAHVYAGIDNLKNVVEPILSEGSR